MNPLFAAATEIQTLCNERDWGFCFIGGLAVPRSGEPRLTRDVALTIRAPYGSEAPIVDELLGRFEVRIDDARTFASTTASGWSRQETAFRSSSTGLCRCWQ